MKRRGSIARLGALASLLTLALLPSCGGSDGGTGPDTPRPTTVAITPANTTLTYIGVTATLTARILDQDGGQVSGAVTWSSDAPTVATVSAGGVVTAVGNGSTTVRATFGSIAGAATVTVEQQVTNLAVLSGNTQSALAGTTLEESVVVRAQDLGGTAVTGVTITFTPDEGSGAVSVSSATADETGQASTSWTLGEAFGPQKLNVSAGGNASVVLTATSLSPVPLPDLVASGALTLQRSDPTSLDTITVQTTVSNDGNASSGQSVRVRLLVDGGEAASQLIGVLEAGGQRTVTFTPGPLTQGTRGLRVEVDPDNAIEELIESNNDRAQNVNVLLQKKVEAGETLSGLGASENTELLFRLDLPFAANNLTVELSGGTGDVDLFLEGGTRPSNREAYNDCQSGSPTTAERCQLAGVSAGPYHILLHAFTTFSGTTMQVTLDGEVLPFNIEVVFINHGTDRQDAAVLAAAERWMSILPVDIPDSDFSAQPLAAGDCIEGQPLINGNVDDLKIFVSIKDIDGLGGTLAQATPCVTRGLGHLPVVGYMQLDSTDLTKLDEDGDLLPVVLHEMGHVLGIGTIWSMSGLLKNPSLPSNSGADTYFNGPLAIEAFDEVGGTAYTLGKKVPVENTAGEGSGDSHWRESVLLTELMTPFYNSRRTNQLSIVSIQSLADLGYQVDVTQADAFTGTFTAPPRVSAASEEGGVDLRGDVAKHPIVVVDQKGRVVARHR